jgi:hypothetical protein
MTFDTYLEFRSVGGPSGSPHPTGQFRAAAEILDVLHVENVRRTHAGEPPIAIALPNVLNGEARNGMGRIRVFGPAEALEALGALVAGTERPDTDRLDVGKPTKVPERHSFAAFVRDRLTEKEFVGHADRTLSRAQRKVMERIARGEAVRKPPMDTETRMASLSDRVAAASDANRLSVRVRSRSTKSGFELFLGVVQSPNGVPGGTIDTYGLSRRSASVPVPHF